MERTTSGRPKGWGTSQDQAKLTDIRKKSLKRITQPILGLIKQKIERSTISDDLRGKWMRVYDEAVKSIEQSKAKDDLKKTAKVTPELLEIAEYNLKVDDTGPSLLDESEILFDDYGDESGDTSMLFKDAVDTDPMEMARKDSKSSSKSKKIDQTSGDISFYFGQVPLLQKELKNVVKNLNPVEAKTFISELKNYNKMPDNQRLLFIQKVKKLDKELAIKDYQRKLKQHDLNQQYLQRLRGQLVSKQKTMK